MPRAKNNDAEIEYETFGNPSHPAVLLVNGYTSQMINYDVDFIQAFVDRGRFVIRYDNRDVGLSTHFHGAPAPIKEIMAAKASGGPLPALAYTMSDMASDGIAVLDALGIAAAHIVGMSMGGMLVQVMAIEHPSRVLSMVSIMSRTGEPEYGQSTPEANAALLNVPRTDREGFIADGVRDRRVYSSPRYFDPEYEAARLARAYDRAFDPAGNARQFAAIVAADPRAEQLRALKVPTLVIHGRADTLITLSGGERTAELIPGANLFVLNDMGHDLPKPLWPVLVEAMVSHQTFGLPG